MKSRNHVTWLRRAFLTELGLAWITARAIPWSLSWRVVLGLTIGLATTELRAQEIPPVPTYRATGGDMHCPYSLDLTTSSFGPAYEAVKSFTLSCPHLGSLASDTCASVVQPITTFPGSCHYSYTKIGYGDHVGGVVEWRLACAPGWIMNEHTRMCAPPPEGEPTCSLQYFAGSPDYGGHSTMASYFAAQSSSWRNQQCSSCPGTVFHSILEPVNRFSTVRCKPADTLLITLIGGGATKALPAGPALPHTAKVTSTGGSPAGKTVIITVGSGASVQGVTDAAGEFHFLYVPPYHRAVVDSISGTCSGCSNTAEKQVNVEACGFCP